jgi:hypothetical protein
LRVKLPPEMMLLPQPDHLRRLDAAASLAFPDGSMSASGLRREGMRGRLTIERIAGKDYTTLANIDRMRELCRVRQPDPTCGSEKNAATDPAESPTPPSGSSSTEKLRRAQSAAEQTVTELRERLSATSTSSTPPPQRRASVTPLR